MRLKFCVLIPMIQVNYQTHLLNPTQNHLVNSTLPIFNLSTHPSLLPSSHTPKTQKSESRKNISISRKCLIFKPFSLFTSVPSTSILLSHNEPCPGTYQHNVSFSLYILARSVRPSLWPGWSAYRKYTPYSAPGNQ